MTPPSNRTADTDWSIGDLHVSGHRIPMRQLALGAVMAASAEGESEPWWAHVWPAGLMLARHVLEGPRLDGVRALDIGTGTGIVGIALGLQGADVTFSDLNPDALALADENARRSGLEGQHLLVLDWCDPPELQFEALYAADVVYDTERIAPLARAFARLLTLDGEALLSDPRRPHFPELLDALPAAGLGSELVSESEEGVVIRLRRLR